MAAQLYNTIQPYFYHGGPGSTRPSSPVRLPSNWYGRTRYLLGTYLLVDLGTATCTATAVNLVPLLVVVDSLFEVGSTRLSSLQNLVLC